MSLAGLAALLRQEGGLLAGAVVDPPAAPAARSLPIEAIREGYELHYGEARVLATEDTDLALLAGDRLYALGLAELAARGDLEAVRTMAELIARAAVAHAAEDPEAAEAAWALAPPGGPPGASDR